MLVKEITLETGLAKPQTSQDLQIQALKRQKQAITQKTKQVKAQQQVQNAQAKLAKVTSGCPKLDEEFLTVIAMLSEN